MKEIKSYLLHTFLFVATFVACMYTGVMWVRTPFIDPNDYRNLGIGFEYAFLLMSFLLVHEMGHYIAAKFHKVNCTLPYFIPFPPNPLAPISFGTMGAIIRMRDKLPSRKALFDIGAAGPLAGFILCFAYFIYGLNHLPTIDYLYQIHPNYIHGSIDSNGLFLGNTLFYQWSLDLFVPKGAFMPPLNEIYHYPYICIGWFGMFVTALNMLPIGQLDGGHITYAMFGDKMHKKIALITWWIITIIGIGGTLQMLVDILSFPSGYDFLDQIGYLIIPTLLKIKSIFPLFFQGWAGWIGWSLITMFLIKLRHPPVEDNENIGLVRMLLGWITLIIFIGSFSFQGIYIVQ